MKCSKCKKELTLKEVKIKVDNYIDEKDQPLDITKYVTEIKGKVVSIGISGMCFNIEDEQAQVYCKKCNSLIGNFELEQKH
ncbi:MAG: hypothetical protein WCV90_06865 [Candidatus Woesearchaeota archaeon]|jgi:hypothetical protein